VNEINNAVYETLGARWTEAEDDPVGLLRAESRARNPWVQSEIAKRKGFPCDILDLGCGAGFLSNVLAADGHCVTGVDLAEGALRVARAEDKTQSVQYEAMDARALQYADESFDAVCAMDVLEHVVSWEALVKEAARVLRPGGLLFFYTFNRNFLSKLLVIKGVSWVVKNTPNNLHVYEMFIKPEEFVRVAEEHALIVEPLRGLRPVLNAHFWRMLATGRVGPGFAFAFTQSTKLSYLGVAVKER
jgi:2-polyprenyl-6-hydroxyphenyl methylase / 3-demethylubiquinone-9 3-methyltransferase